MTGAALLDLPASQPRDFRLLLSLGTFYPPERGFPEIPPALPFSKGGELSHFSLTPFPAIPYNCRIENRGFIAIMKFPVKERKFI
jgi:hypothetical protein